jgi:hypothetical protein
MTLWLTEDAVLVCAHELGQVQNVPTQHLVTVENRRVLVATDPEGKAIKGCPNVGAAIRPCLTTLKVEKGYSPFLTVEDHRICLDSVTGLTDGTPPATVKYKVRHAGQPFVGEES